MSSTCRPVATVVLVTALVAAGCGPGGRGGIAGGCRNEVVASVDDAQGRMRLVRVGPGPEVSDIAVTWPDDGINGPASRPDFSPDGERMVVVRANDNYESAGPTATWLWTTAADGSDPRPVTDGVVYDDYPDWSPDGTMIAFSRLELSADGSGNARVMVVDATGTGAPRALFGDTPSEDRAPRWSPDGRRLAFVRSEPSLTVGSDPADTVMVVAADGSGLREIAVVDDAHTVDWLPEGDALLVNSPASGRESTVHVVDVATGESRRLIDGAAEAVRAPEPSSGGTDDGATIWYLTIVEGDDDSQDWRLQPARVVGGGAAARVDPLGDSVSIGAGFLYRTLGLGIRPCD